MPDRSNPQPHPSERRSEPRVPATRLIEVLPCNSVKDWKFLDAELTDCSRHGLGFVLSESMQPGEQFLLKLRHAGQMRLLLYTVNTCAPAGRGRHRIGARFTELVSQRMEEDPQTVVESLLSGN